MEYHSIFQMRKAQLFGSCPPAECHCYSNTMGPNFFNMKLNRLKVLQGTKVLRGTKVRGTKVLREQKSSSDQTSRNKSLGIKSPGNKSHSAQKMTNIGYFCASDDQTIRIRIFFEEIGIQRLLRPVSLQRPVRSIRLKRFLMPGKQLLRISESSRFLNSII